MKMLGRFLVVIAMLAWGTVRAAEVAPDVLVKTTAQEVLEILKKDKDVKTNQKKILDLVDAKVLPHFDFEHMTALAVGKYWRQATPVQQQALTKEFRTMLVRTYSSSLANYKNQVIEYRPFSMGPGETDVTVKTKVIQAGGPPIPIDYNLSKTSQGWKVYDVVVDNASLVTVYRGSFAAEIRKGGIDALVNSMAEKNHTEINGKGASSKK